MNQTTSWFDNLLNTASTAGSAYINAVATREIARVSTPAQSVTAALSQTVPVGGSNIPVSVLLVGGVVVIAAIWVLKK